MLDALGERGVAFLNVDDAFFPALHHRHKGPAVTFGRSQKADMRCVREERIERGYRFELSDGRSFELNVPGRHNVMNALAALAVCRELGAVDLVRERLACFELPDLRYQVEDVGPVRVIADCYNANLSSMGAAIDEFDETAVAGRRVMVCGDMLEMGRHAESVHQQLGRRIGKSRIDAVWALGRCGRWVVDAARSVRALPSTSIPSVDEAAPVIAESLQPCDTVLVKGSRGMRLERVVEAIRRHHSERRGSASGSVRLA